MSTKGGGDMGEFYFLPEDFAALDRQIREISMKIREIGQEMGASCNEGAETYHDNFAYEDGERQQYMWSSRLRELVAIKNRARIVSEIPVPRKVSIGSRVTILDQETDEEKVLRIGSYMSFQKNTVSYAAPLARILLGSSTGEVRSGRIAGRVRQFEILAVDH